MESVEEVSSAYGDHFTVFIDLIGFAEVSKNVHAAGHQRIFKLLVDVASLKGSFSASQEELVPGQVNSYAATPEVSAFSDHVLFSFPLNELQKKFQSFGDHAIPNVVMHQSVSLISRIAARALSIGFMIRGGATIGKLHHGRGIVFGEGLVDAYKLESETARYPRVVLSHTITENDYWRPHLAKFVLQSCDGLYEFDYYRQMLLMVPDDFKSGTDLKTWPQSISDTVAANVKKLGMEKRLNELSKWAWFAHALRRSVEQLNAAQISDIGISPSDFALPQLTIVQ